MEEEEQLELMTLAEIEALAEDSTQSLHEQTGAALPRLAMSPLRAEHRVRCASLETELPLGSLFYPCCGSDIKDALASFASCVADCHFADPYNPPHGRSPRAAGLTSLFIPHVETVVVGYQECRQIDNFACPVYSHRKDGLLTFIDDVRSLSIFYYRGDSYGEGGSNQRWLEPVLFHAVLSKLLDGGIIATDGSNCGSGHQDKSAPWSDLRGRAAKGTRFEYANRAFLCLGELGDSRRSVRVWQVSSGA